MTDIARLRKGGVGGQFWSVYIPADMAGPQSVRAMMEQIDVVHRLVAAYPRRFEVALPQEVERGSTRGQDRLPHRHGGRAFDRQLPRRAASFTTRGRAT